VTQGKIAANVRAASSELCRELANMRFSAPVTHVYNPLEYARQPHDAYVRRYGASPKTLIFLGMNPGPFGMAQTGVPFGDIEFVRNWLGIEEPVGRPAREHPKRPVLGFECPRREVSGSRLWSAIADHYGRPERFFEKRFIANYCPLVFIEKTGRNRTPDKLPAREREPLFEACDAHLRRLIEIFEAEWVIGIGAFAERRALDALADHDVRVGRVLHPSPANPRAQRDWSGTARRELEALGLCRRRATGPGRARRGTGRGKT
jgi:single-strand selective monofunctional uracil DNA glycosylase